MLEGCQPWWPSRTSASPERFLTRNLPRACPGSTVDAVAAGLSPDFLSGAGGTA
jgi:hypothetical protein